MPHIVITGGSSGIGAAIAELYAARGADITLIARSRPRLEAVAARLRKGPGENAVHIETADVRDGLALSDAVARAEAKLGPCDVLVTSAGIVRPAAFSELPPADFDEQLSVNLIGTANAVRAVYAGMARRGQGAILMISSGAGLTGIYGYTAYCASKYAVHGFAEALRLEAKPAGIRVAVCFPPDTDTPQLANERPARPPEADAVIGAAGLWAASEVAKAAIGGLESGRFLICPGMRLRLLARFGSLAMPVLRLWFDHRVAALAGVAGSRRQSIRPPAKERRGHRR
jgi:short-subunit dehydrogenase